MIVKAGTKKAEQLLDRADYNEGTELWQVYDSVSRAKIQAMEKCKEWCYRDNGYNFRIISHNSFQFSVAWEMEYVDGDTGEVFDATRIETSSNTYIVLHEKEVA